MRATPGAGNQLGRKQSRDYGLDVRPTLRTGEDHAEQDDDRHCRQEGLEPLGIPRLRADPEQDGQEPDEREPRPRDRKRHEKDHEVVEPHDR